MLISCNSEKSNGGDFTQTMSEPLKLSKDTGYEIGLISAQLCYGWPNISEALKNNRIAYRISAVAAWIPITIPDGTYTLGLLNSFLQDAMRAAGHYSAGPDTSEVATSDDMYYITLSANTATGRVKVSISNNYQLNLAPTVSTVTYTLNKILGFEVGLMTTNGDRFGDNVPDMNRGVNQVHIHCSVAGGSYVDGQKTNILYGFGVNVPPYGIMNITPMRTVYLPLTTSTISSISFQITDQDGVALTTGNERTTMLLEILKAR